MGGTRSHSRGAGNGWCWREGVIGGTKPLRQERGGGSWRVSGEWDTWSSETARKPERTEAGSCGGAMIRKPLWLLQFSWGSVRPSCQQEWRWRWGGDNVKQSHWRTGKLIDMECAVGLLGSAEGHLETCDHELEWNQSGWLCWKESYKICVHHPIILKVLLPGTDLLGSTGREHKYLPFTHVQTVA